MYFSLLRLWIIYLFYSIKNKCCIIGNLYCWLISLPISNGSTHVFFLFLRLFITIIYFYQYQVSHNWQFMLLAHLSPLSNRSIQMYFPLPVFVYFHFVIFIKNKCCIIGNLCCCTLLRIEIWISTNINLCNWC
jgi:hypothetical protein